jgi:GT2 family glycosyltransferase
MNICFIFTNYNNSLLSINAILSIWQIVDGEKPNIIIIDNNSELKEEELLRKFLSENSDENLHFLFEENNVGYFRGLNIGIRYSKTLDTQFDYTVVGNNDLIFPNHFLKTLLKNTILYKGYPVISPNIITLDNINQNPHLIKRISIFRKFIYDLYFSNYNLALIINFISKISKKFTKRKDYLNHAKSGPIFMGYGACYILTKDFFNLFEELNAPTFLMGEEAFLSDQIHKVNKEIFYDSEIIVNHHDHASCDNLPVKKMWQITRESYKLYKPLI